MTRLLLFLFFLQGFYSTAQIINNDLLPTDKIQKTYNPDLLTCPEDIETECIDITTAYDSPTFELLDPTKEVLRLPTCANCDLGKLKLRDEIIVRSVHEKSIKRVFYIEEGDEYGTCVQNILRVDDKAPTPFCASLLNLNFELSPITQEAYSEMRARTFNFGVFDYCTPGEKIKITFNNIQPVIDSVIQYQDTMYRVTPELPHFFDEEGFVDFNGDGLSYPEADPSTLEAYHYGNYQKWDPSINSSFKVFTCTDGPWVEQDIYFWDNFWKFDFCRAFLFDNDESSLCSGGNGSGASGIKLDINLFQNTPNPFRDRTTISWQMEEEGQVEILVYNSWGSLVLRSKMEYNKGVNSFSLEKEDLDNKSGIYYYQVNMNGLSEVKKMVMID